MDTKARADRHKHDAELYLQNMKADYLLDHASGLYQPNSSAAENEGSDKDCGSAVRNRPKDSLSDWMGIGVGVAGLIISCFTLIGLAYTVWINHLQWYEAHRTADASIEASEASKDAVSIAENSLKSNTENFRIDLRPYIAQKSYPVGNGIPLPGFVTTGTAFGKARGRVKWEFEIVNYGKTPARNVVMTEEIKVGDGNEYVPDYRDKAPPFDLQPGGTMHDWVISQDMDITQYEEALKADLGISIRVKIRYLWGVTHYESSICLVRTITPLGVDIGLCRSGNYIH